MPSDTFKDHIYALMVAGGGGTRLWPMSREGTPKQFLKLFHNKTLIEITAHRLNKFIPWDRIFVTTVSENYLKVIQRLVPQIPKENFIVEPVRKDSAPAHSVGALYIYERDKDAVIVNSAVDHLMNPESNYIDVILATAKFTYGGEYLATVGIRPTYPHTGYGYLKKGLKVNSGAGKSVYKLDKFTEKPDLDTAKRFLASGHYFWNANQFVWRADSYLKAVEALAPDIYSHLLEIKKSLGKRNEKEVFKREFEKMPKISVEYAIAEKASNFYMLISDYQWTDIGDWSEVWKNLPKDESGNVVICGEEGCGEIINIDSTDALIHSDGRLIAMIDVDNVVVVDTKEALLICSKSRSQSVKKIVERLKEEKKEQYL